jgi:hypothetical protein
MFQEESSILREVVVLVILSKKRNVHVYMRPILNGFRDRTFVLYSTLDLAPNIVLPSCMRISVKRQLAIVNVDGDSVEVL